jgi:hypothetical protein
MPFPSHLKIHLKVIGLAAALLTGPISAAQADVVTPRRTAQLPIDTGIKPWPAPTGHRQPHAADVSPAADLSADLLELEVDRKLRICRGC